MEIHKKESSIKLSPFLKTDFGRLISWVDNEETMVQFAGTYFSFPLTETQLEQYLKDKNRFVYKVVHTPTKTVIGHAEIFFNHTTAILCRILIGEKIYRGKGIGQQIINALLEISFNQHGASTVMLNVFEWNVIAIRCYEKVGFSINPGKLYTSQVNGKAWTRLSMSIDKLTWINLNSSKNKAAQVSQR
jgi:RimJ/RimL family protein N-acetyltransferase